MGWLPSPAVVWDLVKKVEGLLALEAKQSAAMKAMQDEIDDLTERVARLEQREDVIVAKVEGAARAAAMASATAAVADIARRLGGLEARAALTAQGTKRLPKT